MITYGDFIGGGTEARVFDDPTRSDWVIIKIKPTGYAKILVYAQQGMLHRLDFDNGFIIAWVDRCTYWDNYTWRALQTSIYDLLQAVGDCSPCYFMPLTALSVEHINTLNTWGIDIVEIIEAITARGDDPANFVLDLRGDNVMISHKGFVVITDPVVNCASLKE